MKIHRIGVRNFRGFEEFEASFNPGFNLVVGNNNAGKTSLLDAVAIGAGSFFLGIGEVNARSINRDDVRIETFFPGGQPDNQPQYPSEVRCEGEVEGKK